MVICYSRLTKSINMNDFHHLTLDGVDCHIITKLRNLEYVHLEWRTYLNGTWNGGQRHGDGEM